MRKAEISIHQFLINSEPAGRVDDHDGITFRACLSDGATGNGDVVFHPFLGVNRNVDLTAEHLELLDCRGTERIAGCQQHFHSLLALKVVSQFGGEGGLAGTVQSGYQHDSRRAFHADFLRLATHEIGQFVMDDLHHHLLGLHGRQHILPHRLFLDFVAEILRHAEAHVGVQQGAADVFQRCGDVDFGDLSLAPQDLEGPFQSLLQVLKHIP